ncbi:EI24 domain-containing protein [Undibacterium sp. TC4M20W]|uniref:EI24 domain-containing protein n=1 Tax=unclassified Undibacterium TaxID=2630295 RepID=UPI003BF03DB9
MNIASVMRAWGRAVAAQLHYRMLLLTFLPFMVALILWGAAMWWGLQAMMDFIQAWLSEHDGFARVSSVLNIVGLIALKMVVVPLVAMWVLLPLMIFTSLMCIAVFAMPAISKHVGMRDYPELEQKNGGTFLGSMGHSLSSFLIFALIWFVSLPLNLIPFVGLVLQPLLWGWLTYRVMVYDALALHADADERASLIQEHRWSLLSIGIIAGLFGAAPGLLWLGGVVSTLFLPVIAGVAIWVYVLVFVFTGLWFQHYCLEALQRHRSVAPQAGAPIPQTLPSL